jgi:two-component system sensor histidine kinase TctE
LRLREATRRTSQLANQLLALSRADSASADLQAMEQVDLQALCEDILALYLDAATHKHMDLGIEGAPAQVRGHAWLLRELLINIVDNAVKYTPRGGRITLRCGQDKRADLSCAWIEVEDDGPGIAPSERQRVLERFYRLPGAQAEGNGLGLAIASEIARTHGSQLELSTGAGGLGLCVRVAFDAAPVGVRPVRESVEG